MKKKIHTGIIVIAVLVIIGGVVLYCATPKYIVYAVKGTEDGTSREVVYKSVCHDRAKARYLYLNGHKEEGVKHYILMDEEEGNSLIPF